MTQASFNDKVKTLWEQYWGEWKWYLGYEREIKTTKKRFKIM